MRKIFCGYCGEKLESMCDCEREMAIVREELLKELENRPDTQYGWAFEDQLYIMRGEK